MFVIQPEQFDERNGRQLAGFQIFVKHLLVLEKFRFLGSTVGIFFEVRKGLVVVLKESVRFSGHSVIVATGVPAPCDVPFV